MKSHQPRYAIRKYAVGPPVLARVVAADTPTTTESPAPVPTQPSEGESTIS